MSISRQKLAYFLLHGSLIKLPAYSPANVNYFWLLPPKKYLIKKSDLSFDLTLWPNKFAYMLSSEYTICVASEIILFHKKRLIWIIVSVTGLNIATGWGPLFIQNAPVLRSAVVLPGLFCTFLPYTSVACSSLLWSALRMSLYAAWFLSPPLPLVHPCTHLLLLVQINFHLLEQGELAVCCTQIMTAKSKPPREGP